MATFTITGDFDEVSRKLKATLDANDAKFKADLEANLKFLPPSKPVVAAASVAPGAVDSFNGRVRTSRAPSR